MLMEEMILNKLNDYLFACWNLHVHDLMVLGYLMTCECPISPQYIQEVKV